jgi:hypothetical protein
MGVDRTDNPTRKEHEQVGDVARGGTEQGNMLAVSRCPS